MMTVTASVSLVMPPSRLPAPIKAIAPGSSHSQYSLSGILFPVKAVYMSKHPRPRARPKRLPDTLRY